MNAETNDFFKERGPLQLPSDTNVIYFSDVDMKTPVVLNRFWFEEVIAPSYSEGRLPFDENNNKSKSIKSNN